MKTLQRNKFKGFTIIELMIVVMIVAILLAIAYPSYVQYVRKANRGDAQQMLMNWSINQEIWRANHTNYNVVTDRTSPDCIMPEDTDKYSFAVAADATTFTLTATAKGDQAKDVSRDGTSCEILNLRSDGRKYSGGDESILICWN